MQEIKNQDDNSQILPSEINIDTLKSVYYWINAKPDTHIKVFNKPKIISYNDIILLNEKVQNKLKNHHLFTNITSITISFEKGEIKSFNAWEVFKNHPWEIAQKTESISILWDITVQLPEYKLPQKHTLKVRIGSSLKPNEMFQIITTSDDEVELHENLSFIVCKVDFINFVLSKELISIIEEWFNILPNISEKSNFQTFIEKNKQHIARVGHYLTTFTGLVFLYIVFKYHLKNYEFSMIDKGLYVDAYFWIICLFGVYFIFNLLGAAFGQKLFNKINSYKEPHCFNITKGDINEQAELEKKNKKISNTLVWQFIIRLAVSIISIIISKLTLHK